MLIAGAADKRLLIFLNVCLSFDATSRCLPACMNFQDCGLCPTKGIDYWFFTDCAPMIEPTMLHLILTPSLFTANVNSLKTTEIFPLRERSSTPRQQMRRCLFHLGMLLVMQTSCPRTRFFMAQCKRALSCGNYILLLFTWFSWPFSSF